MKDKRYGIIYIAASWFDSNSLFIGAILLSVFSSGIEGTYMAKFNPVGLTWMGYALNFTADMVSLILSRWHGRLSQELTKGSSRLRRSRVNRVLLGVYVAILFSLLFSWRQFRPMVYAIETNPVFSGSTSKWEIEILAILFASFVPVLNAFLGFAQSLRDGKFDDDVKSVNQNANYKPAVVNSVERIGDAVDLQPLDDTAMKIYEIYIADKNITKTKLAELAGVSRPTVNERLKRLKSHGKI